MRAPVFSKSESRHLWAAIKREALQLPKIVRFLSREDAPESECPHCGARGRFTFYFLVEGGQRLGAMAGCLRLFPASQIAREDLRLREKEATYAKRGWTLNRRDADAVQAIEQFYTGTRDERSALAIVHSAKRANGVNARGRS